MSTVRKAPQEYLKEPYSRVFTLDHESGTYTAEILEFPGCISQGCTVEEANHRLEKAAVGWIEAAIDLGQKIPHTGQKYGYSGKVALRLPKSVHRQAALAAERDGTSLNQFIVAAVAEKVGIQNAVDYLEKKLMKFQLMTNFIENASYNPFFKYDLDIEKLQGTTEDPTSLNKEGVH